MTRARPRENERERDKEAENAGAAACEGCIMGLRREWPYQSCRVTKVAPRGEGERDGGEREWKSGSRVALGIRKFATIHVAGSSLRKTYTTWGRGRTRLYRAYLKSWRISGSIFPRRKFDWPLSRSANFLIFNIRSLSPSSLLSLLKTGARAKIPPSPG